MLVCAITAKYAIMTRLLLSPLVRRQLKKKSLAMHFLAYIVKNK
jgi:hypothetical protein